MCNMPSDLKFDSNRRSAQSRRFWESAQLLCGAGYPEFAGGSRLCVPISSIETRCLEDEAINTNLELANTTLFA